MFNLEKRNLLAAFSASSAQEAAMTALVDATAGIIRFRTPSSGGLRMTISSPSPFSFFSNESANTKQTNGFFRLCKRMLPQLKLDSIMCKDYKYLARVF